MKKREGNPVITNHCYIKMTKQMESRNDVKEFAEYKKTHDFLKTIGDNLSYVKTIIVRITLRK